MVTKPEIVDFETQVIQTKALMVRIHQAVREGMQRPGGHTNDDYWGTLSVNMRMLITETTRAVEAVDKLRGV